MFGILYSSIDVFFTLIEVLIFVRVLMSWLPVDASRGIPALIYALTEPILGPIRMILRRSPIGGMMIDISPVLAILLLGLIKRLVVNVLIMALF